MVGGFDIRIFHQPFYSFLLWLPWILVVLVLVLVVVVLVVLVEWWYCRRTIPRSPSPVPRPVPRDTYLRAPRRTVRGTEGIRCVPGTRDNSSGRRGIEPKSTVSLAVQPQITQPLNHVKDVRQPRLTSQVPL